MYDTAIESAKSSESTNSFVCGHNFDLSLRPRQKKKKARNDIDTDLYVRYAKCKRTAFTRGFHSARLEQLIVEQTQASASIQARRSLALYIFRGLRPQIYVYRRNLENINSGVYISRVFELFKIYNSFPQVLEYKTFEILS